MAAKKDQLPVCSADKTELVLGLRMFASLEPGKATRNGLVQMALDHNVFYDIHERAWLCHSLGLDFNIALTNLELVEVGVESGLDFDRFTGASRDAGA
jgi:hypothetical protein